MGKTRVALLAVALVLGLGRPLPSDANPAVPSGTLCGFNQPWIPNKYMVDLTSSFDPNDWDRVCRRARAAEAKVVRVFALKGIPVEGVLWHPADPHWPVGVDPALLRNIETVGAIARQNGLAVYWTLMDGAVILPYMPKNPSQPMSQLERDRFWNIYNDDYGVGGAFRANVLGPVVDAISRNPAAIWAIDIHNEIDGPVTKGLFRGWWLGARTFLQKMAAFVHARAPGVRLASSLGGSNEGSYFLLLGFVDGLGLDFYDIHSYSDRGEIPNRDLLAGYARLKGTTIVLGEFGMKSLPRNDAMQAVVVSTFLANAKHSGFEAAFCWELESEAPNFSCYDGATPKPALAYFTWWATH